MDFDRYKDTYRDELDGAISFAGAGIDFYTEVKVAELVGLAARELREPSRLRVLDAGCGPGETDTFLRDTFAGLSGADVSAAMVDAAARRNPWATYRHFDAGEPLPFDDGRFDLSFAICVLHHIEPEDRGEFMRELVRVTAPGGIVAIFEHNPMNPGTRKVVRDCGFDEGVQLLPMREVRSLQAGQGLIPVDRGFILVFPWRGSALRRIERGLARVPIGAQYYVAGRVPQPVI